MALRTILNSDRKCKTLIMTIPILALAFLACADHVVGPYDPEPRDTTPPPVPTGVTTTTMDQQILVEWNPIIMDPSHDDLAGYKVYRSRDNSNFYLMATVSYDVTSYLDAGLENGTTYYYAVSSYDYSGHISELSRDNAFDTPRPEGSTTLYSLTEPDYDQLSGFDFSTEERLPWDDMAANFYLEFDNTPDVNTFFIWVANDGSRIQDMGYTGSFDEITYAPETGWSSFRALEAIRDHTYVIRTANNHYAKIRVNEAGFQPYRMNFDWGYQIDPGNRELRISPPNGKIATVVNGGSF